MRKEMLTQRTLVIFLASLLLITPSCRKNNSTNNPPGSGGTPPVSYSYTDPINIRLTDPSAFSRITQEVITANYIFSSISTTGGKLTINRIPIGSNSPTILTSQNLSTIGMGGGFPVNFYYVYANSGGIIFGMPNITLCLFDVEKNESNIIMLVQGQNPLNTSQYYKQIIKWNLATGQLTKLLPDNTNSLDILVNIHLKSMRLTNDGTLYIASMANNGCVLKVSPSGMVSPIATNLINPGFFDIYNGILYVPINSASNGKIVKIDQNNSITDVIQNLTGPTNVAIDKYGNLLVRSQTTIDGGNYHRYDLYKMDGTNIGNVKDGFGVSILSNTYENTPMTFDSFNNLYFYHADGVISGGLTYNNPVGQKGLFKMGIIKN